MDCKVFIAGISHTTADLYHLITGDFSKITVEDTEKLALIRTLAEKRCDFDTLDALIGT